MFRCWKEDKKEVMEENHIYRRYWGWGREGTKRENIKI